MRSLPEDAVSETLCKLTLGSHSFDAVYRTACKAGGEPLFMPYADWDEFQSRNRLPDSLIADLKAAYPDGFSAMDAWVGLLIEASAWRMV